MQEIKIYKNYGVLAAEKKKSLYLWWRACARYML